MRKVFRGIQALHPSREKRARPLQLEQLEIVASWLDGQIAAATAVGDIPVQLRCTRDKAILLLGFWRGFRGDELTRVQVEYMEITPREGLTCYLPRTKGDRAHEGTTFKAPALARLCPVDACSAWIALSGLTDGPLFRGVDRWGNVAEKGLHINSFVPLLRSLFSDASISFAVQYSGHSLRRGFAQWATANGWDIKTLMEYVGWKNVQSALRYVEGADPFVQYRRQQSNEALSGNVIELEGE